MNAKDYVKGAPINANSIKPKAYRAPLTLREYITENGTQEKLVPYLKELSKKNGWQDHYKFFVANMSGDITTFSPEDRKKCEKLLKDLKQKYAEDYG